MREMMKCKLSACAFFLLLCSACSLSWLRFDQPSQLNAAAAQRITDRLAGSDNFTFAVVGDSRGNPEKFQEILAAAAAHDPAFIIHAGDFSTIGSAGQYAEAVKVLQGCAVPVVVVPGNHDMVAEGGKIFRRVFGPPDFYMQIGTYRFIFIDTTDGKLDGEFVSLPGKKELLPLDRICAGADNVVIVAHTPPAIATLRVHGAEAITGPFIELIRNNSFRIRAVLCGHLHGYAQASVSGVPLIISGGAGAPLYSDRGEGFVGRFNYVLVNVRGRSLSHTVHFVD